MTESSARADDGGHEGRRRGELERSAEGDLESDEVVEGEVQPDRRLSEPTSFTGPLPPPSVLEEYGEVVPGLDRDIVGQWTSETAHRHQTVDGLRRTDHDAMRAYYEGEKRGQYLGFAVLVGVLAIAALSVVMDQPAVGIASLIAAGGAAVWALRRGSLVEGPPPTDIGHGDEVEKPPPDA